MNDQDKYLNETERLLAMLNEDLESADDAHSALEVVTQLKLWQAPNLGPESTRLLIEKLAVELPGMDKEYRRNRLDWWPLLLMQSQLRVVHREIWAATLLVMTLGTLVTLGTYSNLSQQILPMTILAPIVAAVGVAFLYDSDSEQMMELENSTPSSVRLLLLARLTLVFGFNLILGLVASLLLTLLFEGVLLWPLIMSWLVPMSFLSALAFFSSTVTRDATLGAVIGMTLWGMHVFISYVPEHNFILHLLSWPGLSAPESRPILFVLAGLLVTLAIWLGANPARHTRATS